MALAVLLAGCGDPALWARYRAERDLWRARRTVERVALRPAMASPADIARARDALEAISRRYPIARWAPAAARGPGAARDVVLIAGRAQLALGRIDEMESRLPQALERYARMSDLGYASPELEREAAEARAVASEHAGHPADAYASWARLCEIAPLIDPASGHALPVALEAPQRAAEQLANLGREAAADSLLDAASARLRAALAEPGLGPRDRAELYFALAGQRQSRGDLDGALDAMRGALGTGLASGPAQRTILSLGEQSLAAGRADSARIYARWAAAAPGALPPRDALLLEARAWQVSGPPDSALEAWGNLLDAYPKAQDEAAEARFQRGLILEGLGRWAQARTELHALAASQPTHPRAFEAQVHIVQHHARLGEMELARLEGRRAIEVMDQMIATQHDDEVQQRARRARADIWLAMGETGAAADALDDLWTRYPSGPVGAQAGLDAARLLSGLGRRARADSIFAKLARDADDPAVRAAARATYGGAGR